MTTRSILLAVLTAFLLAFSAVPASAGNIGKAVHRSRRLAQWELGQAGLSLVRGHGSMASAPGRR